MTHKATSLGYPFARMVAGFTDDRARDRIARAILGMQRHEARNVPNLSARAHQPV